MVIPGIQGWKGGSRGGWWLPKLFDFFGFNQLNIGILGEGKKNLYPWEALR